MTFEQCWHRVPGGTATSVLQLADALLEREDVELVGVAAHHRAPAPEAFVPPVPISYLPFRRTVLYETWHALRTPKVEVATGRVDVVHGTAVAVPPSNAPLVMTIHDLAFLADPSSYTRHGNRFFRRGTKLARRHARLVMVPSESTARECRDAGFDPDDIRIVPWGVDPVEPDIDVDTVRLRHGLDRPYLLFVGTVEPRKNLAAVIAAAAGLDGMAIDLAIVGPDGWSEDVGRLLRPLAGTSVRVKRLGFVPRTDLPALYAGCTVFCFPSLREGFGMPVLEAMAAGAPVVTSRGTATAEVGGDSVLLAEPTDRTAVAHAVRRIVENPGLADDLRHRARERSRIFTWERAARLTAQVYSEASA